MINIRMRIHARSSVIIKASVSDSALTKVLRYSLELGTIYLLKWVDPINHNWNTKGERFW